RWNSLTGGDNGINMHSRPNFGLDLANEVTFFYLVCAFFAASMLAMYVLVRSPFGRFIIICMHILILRSWVFRIV
ncbi:MAG TPA: hypothetical protein VLB84_05485, partial [Bacteroidia bacterium]|nr:hypothetical protein [Bacteroidia bacterium]